MKIHLTSDDITKFLCVIFVVAKEVSEAHYHQAQDGDEDSKPLTFYQATPQKSHREQTSENDNRSTQHLEAGGTGHVESWRKQERF